MGAPPEASDVKNSLMIKHVKVVDSSDSFVASSDISREKKVDQYDESQALLATLAPSPLAFIPKLLINKTMQGVPSFAKSKTHLQGQPVSVGLDVRERV